MATYYGLTNQVIEEALPTHEPIDGHLGVLLVNTWEEAPVHFKTVATRFDRAIAPGNRHADKWQSPYRLLAGAAYSIGQAECVDASGPVPRVVPPNWWSQLRQVAEPSKSGAAPEWFGMWFASYMLTNAICRIAAAAEKTCYLAGVAGTERGDILNAVRDANSAFSKRLPIAHKLLSAMPAKRDRAAHLNKARSGFKAPQPIRTPLVCAFIQTDTDKHVPYPPEKNLDFDFALATSGFEEACDLWDAAVQLPGRAP